MFWMRFVLLLFFVVDCIVIGKIENNRMISIINKSLFNISQEQCICEMIKSTESVFALNYFSRNQTCQLLDSNTNSSLIQFYFNATLIFINQSVISTTNNELTTTLSDIEYLWPFDSTYKDFSSTYNGRPVNDPSFDSSTITGFGSSLSLSFALNQSVVMEEPYLNLSQCSWTFEAWIYPTSLINASDYPIITQCASLVTEKCLHLTLRYQRMYLGFFGDDMGGITTLTVSKWHHVAYVFDSVSLKQSVYLNGIFDNSRQAFMSYQGNTGSLIIGTRNDTYYRYFDGLIDQLYYINRAKTSSEILDDATLTLRFSFDNGSVYDGGPLKINGSLFGSTNVIAGKIGDALELVGLSANSYVRVSGLVLLGTSNQSYTISIWIKPAVINSSSIIHVSSGSNGDGYWCLGMLSLSSSGQVIATSYSNGLLISIVGPIVMRNEWTHLVITYSMFNGLRLYVNGTLRNSTIPFSYFASGSQNFLFLGNSLGGTICYGIYGQFFGAVDELRLYSRELTASYVLTLFNP